MMLRLRPNRVTVLDEDPFTNPVEFHEVIDAAPRLLKVQNKNWS